MATEMPSEHFPDVCAKCHGHNLDLLLGRPLVFEFGKETPWDTLVKSSKLLFNQLQTFQREIKRDIEAGSKFDSTGSAGAHGFIQ